MSESRAGDRRNIEPHEDGKCDQCRVDGNEGGFLNPVTRVFLCVNCKLGSIA